MFLLSKRVGHFVSVSSSLRFILGSYLAITGNVLVNAIPYDTSNQNQNCVSPDVTESYTLIKDDRDIKRNVEGSPTHFLRETVRQRA